MTVSPLNINLHNPTGNVPHGPYSRAAAGFSAVAPIYDLETETNPIVRWARRQTLRRLTRLFAAGDLVLELGCGTGVEATALAKAGVRVAATDVAPGMLAVAHARIRKAGMQDRVSLRQLAAGDLAELLRIYETGSFAGAYSSFGPLNCEPDLPKVAAGLHALLRPHGRVVIMAINRFHPFEFAWYAVHGDLRRATRRWSGYAEGTVSPNLPDRVPTYYHTPRAFARAFAPNFRLVRYHAVLLLLPPPYLAHLLERYPRLFRAGARLERRIAAWPVLRGLGDHFVLELERI